MSSAECRPDTYVGCSTPEPLPECEDGWEFSNTGDAVCATQVPSDLAVTGGGVPAEPIIGGSLLLILGVAILTRKRWTRG